MITCPRNFVIVLIATATLLLGIAPATAQEKNTTSEDIAFAYFKTAGITPDFENWARGSEAFKSIAPALVADYVEKEKQRLTQKWRNLNPQEMLITLKTPILIELETTVNDKQKEMHHMRIIFEQGQIDYFPYIFQSYNFAVIPQGMETALVQELPQAQFKLLQQEFGERMSGDAILRMHLKPVKSYTDQPYEMDKIEQWVLLANIASMSLASVKNDAQLWNYGAEGYVSPDTKAVQDLYKSGKPLYPLQ